MAANLHFNPRRRSFTTRQRDMAKRMLAAGKSILQVHVATRVSIGSCGRIRRELVAEGVLKARGVRRGPYEPETARWKAKTPKKRAIKRPKTGTPDGFIRALTPAELMGGR